ncbi:MAG: hypothetical protein BWX49_02434 [Bacteroidetes bacterium ADurb.Bin008]|jgi:hypothetical protein|nr:MAG: hypothetical protein BWX49_02434 [Bacteroidetes bacterium ADurb.Bin008]
MANKFLPILFNKMLIINQFSTIVLADSGNYSMIFTQCTLAIALGFLAIFAIANCKMAEWLILMVFFYFIPY